MSDRREADIMAALNDSPVSITLKGDDWALISATLGWAAKNGDPRYSDRLAAFEKHIDVSVVWEVNRQMAEKEAGQ